MNSRGFSLIELMTVCALFTAVSGVLFGAYRQVGDAASLQRSASIANEEARRAVYAVNNELRQAMHAELSPLPAAQLRYRVPIDRDGDGTALDAAGNVELSEVRTIGLDVGDANGDGLTTTQLVLLEGGTARVLANNLASDEVEDTNGNGRLDRGLWFSVEGDAVRVDVVTQTTFQISRVYQSTLSQRISPRN